MDNNEFRKQVQQNQQLLEDLATQTMITGNHAGSLGNTFKQAFSKLGIQVGIEDLKNFAKEIIRVRGEYQQLEVTLKAILGSKSQADKLMGEITAITLQSPFDLETIASGAKQLIAVGDGADGVSETLSRLGDIAAGLSLPLNDIVSIYANIQSVGQVCAKDLEEFTSRGIPVVNELAAKFGITESQVSSFADAGKIGFSDMQHVLLSLTNAGGKFYGMMAEQSKTLKGQIGNLQDVWSNMLNEIGKDTEGVASAVVSGATTMVENYDKIGKALIVLISMAGAYKAACIAQIILTQSLAATQMQLGLVLVKLRKSFMALTATMNLNPYVLAATLIAGLVTAMIAFGDSATTAEKAQRRFNEAQKKFNEQQSEKRNNIEQLINVIRSETETEKAKLEAYRQLQTLSPALTSAYSREAIAVTDLAKAQKLLNEERDKAEYENAINNIGKLEKSIQKLKETDGKTVGSTSYGQAVTIDNSKMITEQEGQLKLYQEQIKKIEELRRIALEEQKPVEVKIMEAKADLDQIQEEFAKAKAALEEEKAKQKNNPFHVIPFTVELRYQEAENEKLEKNAHLKKLEELRDSKKTYGKMVSEAVSAIKEAQTQLNKLLDSGTTTTAEEIATARRKLQTAQSDYSTLTGESYKKPSDGIGKLNQQIIDAERALEKERMSIMQDGRKKRLEQSRQEWEEKKAALEKEYLMLLENYRKQGTPLPESATGTHKERLSENDRAKDQRDKSINQQYEKEYETHQKTLTGYLQTEESKRVQTIKERYEKEREWARLKFEAGDINENQYKDFIINVNTAETQENLLQLINKYQSFSQQRADIEKNFSEEIKTLESLRTQETSESIDRSLAEINKRRKAALSSVTMSEFKEDNGFNKIFDNLGNLTDDVLVRFHKKLKEFIDKSGKSLSSEDFKSISESFRKLDLKVASNNPFDGFKSGMQTYRESIDRVKQAQRELTDVQTGKAVVVATQYDSVSGKITQTLLTEKEAEDRLRNAQLQRSSSLEKLNTSLNAGVSQAREYLAVASGITTALSSFGIDIPEQVTGVIEGLGTTLDGLGSIDFTKPMSVVTGGLKAISGIGKAIGSAFNNDGKKQKNIEQLQKQIEVLEQSYNKLGQAVERAYSSDASKMIEQQNVMLEQQKTLIQNQIQEEKSKKKSDDNKIKEWEKQIEAINSVITDNRVKAQDAIFGSDVRSAIDEFAQAYVDAWTAGENKANAMKDVVKNMIKGVVVEMLKGDFGPTVQKIRDKIEDMLKDGIIDATEQAELDRIIEEESRKADEKYGWADHYLKGDEKIEDTEAYSQSSSSKGFAAMSQESADELNGRFTSLQMSGEEIRSQSVVQTSLLSELSVNMDNVKLYTQNISTEVSEMKDIALSSMNHLSAIEKNTKHLQFMRDDLSRIKDKVNNL